MTLRISTLAFAITAFLSIRGFAADEVEVLAKGPVHEAYAEPSEREPVATPPIAKEPPKPVEELPPDQKPEGDNVHWLPGYWAWDEDKKDFLWISGFWRISPPGRSWVPGSWRKVADGWQWNGGFWAAAKADEKKADIEYLPQPPAPLDNAGPTTPAPTESHIYAPGSWVYRDTRYVWRPGFWYEYRSDWVWIPAHYRWTPAGYVFLDGYWDYPLANRGVLFAPVYIPPAIYAAPAYVYTPTVVVREECLFGAFFHRRGWGCYYFGDYFAPSYATLGFTSWCGHVGLSVSIGLWHDPLFAYYHCGYRHDPYWRAGVFDLYAGRYRGDYARPPVTLVQQNTVINNITKNTTVKNVNVNNVTMLTSLNNAGTASRKLQTVPDAERRSQQEQAKTFRTAADNRTATENTLVAKGGAASRTSAPRTGTLDVVAPPVKARSSTLPKDTGTGGPKVGSSTLPSMPLKNDPGPGVTIPRRDPGAGTGTTIPRKDPAILGQPDPLKGKSPTGPRSDPLPKTPRGLDLPNTPGGALLPKTDLVKPKGGPELSPHSTPKGDPPPKKSKSTSSYRGQMDDLSPRSLKSQSVAKPPVRLPPVSVPKPPASLPQTLRSRQAPTRVPAAPKVSPSRPAPKSSGSKHKPTASQTPNRSASTFKAPVVRQASAGKPAPAVLKAPAKRVPVKAQPKKK